MPRNIDKATILASLEEVTDYITSASADAAAARSEAEDAESNADKAAQYVEKLHRQIADMQEDRPITDKVMMLLHECLDLDDDLIERDPPDDSHSPSLSGVEEAARRVLAELHSDTKYQAEIDDTLTAAKKQTRMFFDIALSEMQRGPSECFIPVLKDVLRHAFIRGVEHGRQQQRSK